MGYVLEAYLEIFKSSRIYSFNVFCLHTSINLRIPRFSPLF